ncbi:MAG: DUF2384 domain-containing protein [Oligoflexus sp.]
MNQVKLQERLPIYRDNGFLDFEKIARIIGCRISDIALVVGASERTLKKPRISPTTIKKSQPLIHLLNLLWKLFDGKESEIRCFLNEPRVEWYGISPLTALQQGKAEAVIKMLERAYHGEEGLGT